MRYSLVIVLSLIVLVFPFEQSNATPFSLSLQSLSSHENVESMGLLKQSMSWGEAESFFLIALPVIIGLGTIISTIGSGITYQGQRLDMLAYDNKDPLIWGVVTTVTSTGTLIYGTLFMIGGVFLLGVPLAALATLGLVFGISNIVLYKQRWDEYKQLNKAHQKAKGAPQSMYQLGFQFH